MTTLRQRMIDAMVLLGFRPRTQVSYLKAVSQIARYYHRNPELITDQEVQAYLREPPYGSDGPLRGDEFMAADVADGSVAGTHERPLTGTRFFWLGAPTPLQG